MRIVTTFLLLSLLGAAHLGNNAGAQTVYRCTVDGKTSYADRPCERGTSVALPPPASGVDASLGAVRTDDSRALLELEKLRTAREARERKAERDDLRAARAAQARAKGCRRLRLRVQRAEEDLAAARGGNPAAARKAQQRLRRTREDMAAECRA